MRLRLADLKKRVYRAEEAAAKRRGALTQQHDQEMAAMKILLQRQELLVNAWARSYMHMSGCASQHQFWPKQTPVIDMPSQQPDNAVAGLHPIVEHMAVSVRRALSVAS